MQRSSRTGAIAALMAAAALAGVAASPSPATETGVKAPGRTKEPAQRTSLPPIPRDMRSILGGTGYGSRGSQRRRGPGWTQAQVKRMARKKRNQIRHRKACRG